jgi:SAM-dependent methyltransferase
MAITNNCAKFLFYAKSNGVHFGNTLTLGRLNLYATKERIQRNIIKFQNNSKQLNEVVFKDEYSEPLFQILGAESTDSLDYSDYEKATIVHDLNRPIPENLKNKFDAIIDGGTMEHVFNFPVAIKNCMEALKVGGHYIGISPSNNQMGHGFYQFSPDLYYRVFSNENGFRIKKMIITPLMETEEDVKWFEVEDPKNVNSRVMLVNNFPVSLMIIAEKLEAVEIFKITPQQTDYANTWAASDSLKTGIRPEGIGMTKHVFRNFVPKPLKNFLKNVYDLFTKEKIRTAELGEINPLHYKEIKV